MGKADDPCLPLDWDEWPDDEQRFYLKGWKDGKDILVFFGMVNLATAKANGWLSDVRT